MYWIALGDIHESTSILPLIPDLKQADGVIITGDITNRGSREAARTVFDAVTNENPRVLAQPGNMDTDIVSNFLDEQGVNIHRKVRELAPGLGLMGVGLSAPTPFGTPGEVEEDVLCRWLDETHARANGFEHLVAAIHEPPHGSKVDRITGGHHVGSPGVRAFIERTQPTLVITGHIHESQGVDHIGETTVINPGMLAGGGYVRIDFRDGGVSAELMSV